MFALTIALLIVFTADASNVKSRSTADDGWLQYGNQCYFFGLNGATWFDADAACMGMESHLVKIENKWIDNWLWTKRPSAQSYYWIGLTDIENEGNFTWNIDNTVASYTQWASGYGKVAETYDVVAWGWKDGWFDYPPSYKYGYICQRDFCQRKNQDNIVTTNRTGWLRFGNDCYFFGTNGVDWFTANDDCKQRGSHLAKMYNNTLDEWLMTKKPTAQSYYWIGLTDMTNEGQFRWTIDNTTLTFSNWASTYGTAKGSPDRSDVVAWGWSSGWFDYPATDKYGYVCQSRSCNGAI
ncbi:macrophage mannose receptor 1-like [Mytilus edulis]|uniref:macrophage mannose receptor 1-like n=1 Tax=Mytilus edulis TaxID=6550 RepID=UPI0039F1223B